MITRIKEFLLDLLFVDIETTDYEPCTTVYKLITAVFLVMTISVVIFMIYVIQLASSVL